MYTNHINPELRDAARQLQSASRLLLKAADLTAPIERAKQVDRAMAALQAAEVRMRPFSNYA